MAHNGDGGNHEDEARKDQKRSIHRGSKEGPSTQHQRNCGYAKTGTGAVNG